MARWEAWLPRAPWRSVYRCFRGRELDKMHGAARSTFPYTEISLSETSTIQCETNSSTVMHP